MNNLNKPIILKQKVLGYELDSVQDVYLNNLLPAVFGCLFYILHFSCDLAVGYRHFKEYNPIWASLTYLFLYAPAIGCFIISVSTWELWPVYGSCGKSNVKWCLLKICQHLLFPIWSLWRFAEKIFWSIEAVRAEDEEEREVALSYVKAPRTVELYFFLQGYLQAVPQIFLQLHILMRFVDQMDKQTVDIQGASIVLNLIKMALTTTLYQRFKKQKLGGKDYPWFKYYKQVPTTAVDGPNGVITRMNWVGSPLNVSNPLNQVGKPLNGVGNQIKGIDSLVKIIYCTKTTEERIKRKFAIEEESQRQLLERRRSSDFYLEPSTSFSNEARPTLIETSRETSIIDGPRRMLYTEDVLDAPRRVVYINALPEDDAAGRTVSFFWWFCFLLARMLSISSFAYFYPTEIFWVLGCHFFVAVTLLLYDAESKEIRKTKAVFFVFVGLIYLFCLIEFKIKFRKAKFWYYGFFTAVFVENFVMCLVWWCVKVDLLLDDWWFTYVFYLIVGSSLLSLVSMVFYLRVDKPEPVPVGQRIFNIS